jgi:NDP-sugar pyrophosphorylase family protein
MQCLILAGGLGTRMRAVAPAMPKALLPIRGRPFIRYQLDWLAAHGIDRVVVSIGHRGDMIRAALAGAACGVALVYSDEGEDLRGTGGAVRFAIDQGLLDPGFLLLYGDSYLPIDPRPLWAASGEGRHPTMAVLKNDGRWDRSNVVFRGGMVALYDKTHPDPAAAGIAYIDYGLSVLTREAVCAHVAQGGKADLGAVFAAESRAGRLRGYEVFERFYEIGSPQGLADLTAYLDERARLGSA